MLASLRMPLYTAEQAVAPGTVVAVTGASSFLAAAIIRRLLAAGCVVHGTARNPNDETKLGHLSQLPGAQDRLRLFQADLMQPGSFDAAFKGCKYVIHVAANVTGKAPKGRAREVIVDPAVRGMANVLDSVERSGSVKRVVMTSSVIAVMGGSNVRDPSHVFTEEDWNLVPGELLEEKFPYGQAKVESEARAWEVAKLAGHAHAWQLVTILPGVIIGPPDVLFGSDLMRAFVGVLSGKYGRWTFPIGLPVVDVDDCAAVHVLAMLNPDASGRYLCSAGSPLTIDTFRETNALYPDVMSKCRLPTKVLPKWLVWFLCWLTGTFPELVTSLYGRQLQLDCSRVRNELGAVFMAPSRSTADMAVRLLELGAFKPRRPWGLFGK